MSDYLDQLEHDLRRAVRRRSHMPWYARLRARHSRAVVVVFAALAIAGPAVAAVALLQRGAPVRPVGPSTPRAFQGVALKAGTQMLSLRTPDPDGGPAWGMRLIHTTRGLLCMQVGRVGFGTVGALGQDGAFDNDGRFHAFSANYLSGLGSACVTPDASGNGFYNVEALGFPASALDDDQNARSGCAPAYSAHPRPQYRPGAGAGHASQRPLPVCPASSLRQLSFGVLGPDAVSITHVNALGRLISTPTSGPDGAYVIVLPDHGPLKQNGETDYDTSAFWGPLRAIHYRNGQTCHMTAPSPRNGDIGKSCPPVGYATPQAQLPTDRHVRSAISIKLESARYYCHSITRELTVPCDGAVPPGFTRMTAFSEQSQAPRSAPLVLVQVSFVTRVPITNGQTAYRFVMSNPPRRNIPYHFTEACAHGGRSYQSEFDYRVGQRVTFSTIEPLSCIGTVHGSVRLISTGASSPSERGTAGQHAPGRLVGTFEFHLG